MHGSRVGLLPLLTGIACVGTLVLSGWCWHRAAICAAEQGGRHSGPQLAPPLTAPQHAVEQADQPLPELEQYAAPRRFSRVLPPVADRIVWDPSLAETPSLPTIPAEPRDEPTEPSLPRPEAADAAASPRPTARVQRSPMTPAAERTVAWPWPRSLVARLETLQCDGIADSWAGQVLQGLEQLHEVDSFTETAAGQQLQTLHELHADVPDQVAQLSDISARAHLLRAAYALERRLAVWQPIHKLADPPLTPVSRTVPNPENMDVAAALRQVQRRLRQVEQGDQWHAYLGLDQLEPIAARPRHVDANERSQVARLVLNRMVSHSLTDRQQAVFQQSPYRELNGALRSWVCEPVDYRALLDDLERVESNWDEITANRIARQYQILRWSPVAPASELAQWMNTHYRNANVRVSVSDELVNRLLPDLEEQDEPVNDVLLGSRILGRSQVSTQLRVVLVPDSERWHLGLEAQGQVRSNTSTRHGPAKFYNSGRAHYLARKLLWIDRLGLRAHRAKADAVSNANLTGLETDLDRVPLVNSLARSIARQQYDSQSRKVGWRIRDLIASRAQARLDEEVDRQLGQLSSRFRDRVYQPLDRLGLQPEAVDLETTRTRLVARYRLAGEYQLAAFTPRPQAPANSLLSVQVHESALNNTVEALDLSQQPWELRGLFREIANRLQLQHYEVPADVPEDVQIRLAVCEPIHLRFADDRIRVRLRIARLTADRRTWRNLEVKAIYAPHVDGLHTRLRRDGYVQLKARRLSFGDQLALRAIFSKVLPEEPEIDFVGNTLGKQPHTRDLAVTQFVLRDGWLGIALTSNGPVRMHLADRPAGSDEATR